MFVADKDFVISENKILYHILVAICTGGCGVNKECTAPDTCTCVQGWTGQDCLTGIEIALACNTIISALDINPWPHTLIVV